MKCSILDIKGHKFCIIGLVIGLLLLLLANAVNANTLSNGIGLLVGGGVLGSHLSDRTYTGLVYDRGLPSAWQLHDYPRLRIFAEFNLSRWGGCAGAYCRDVTDVGITPFVRYIAPGSTGITWYADGGLGVHLISHTRIGPQVYSTAFQFSEFAGIGLRLGRDKQYDLGIRYMHESNANIKTPNNGMNFLLMRLAVFW